MNSTFNTPYGSAGRVQKAILSSITETPIEVSARNKGGGTLYEDLRVPIKEGCPLLTMAGHELPT